MTGTANFINFPHMMNNYNNRFEMPKTIVGTLILINIVIAVPFILAGTFNMGNLQDIMGKYLALNIGPRTYLPVTKGAIWQLVTAMFLHGSIGHIIFNMYGLYMFGSLMEKIWGWKRFLTFYMVTGILTNIFSTVVYLAMGTEAIYLLGASGALYALFLAFACYFPDATLYLFFAIPVKAKWAVLLMAGLSVFFQLTGSFGGISHIAHLFGFVAAFFYLLLVMKINPIDRIFRS